MIENVILHQKVALKLCFKVRTKRKQSQIDVDSLERNKFFLKRKNQISIMNLSSLLFLQCK